MTDRSEPAKNSQLFWSDWPRRTGTTFICCSFLPPLPHVCLLKKGCFIFILVKVKKRWWAWSQKGSDSKSPLDRLPGRLQQQKACDTSPRSWEKIPEMKRDLFLFCSSVRIPSGQGGQHSNKSILTLGFGWCLTGWAYRLGLLGPCEAASLVSLAGRGVLVCGIGGLVFFFLFGLVWFVFLSKISVQKVIFRFCFYNCAFERNFLACWE